MKILIPIGDRVLVLRGQTVSKTSSGLILPDTAAEKPLEGVVVRVGWRSSEADRHVVKPGCTVLLPKFGGTELTFSEQVYTLIPEEDLLGVIVDEERVTPR